MHFRSIQGATESLKYFNEVKGEQQKGLKTAVGAIRDICFAIQISNSTKISLPWFYKEMRSEPDLIKKLCTITKAHDDMRNLYLLPGCCQSTRDVQRSIISFAVLP